MAAVDVLASGWSDGAFIGALSMHRVPDRSRQPQGRGTGHARHSSRVAVSSALIGIETVVEKTAATRGHTTAV